MYANCVELRQRLGRKIFNEIYNCTDADTPETAESDIAAAAAEVGEEKVVRSLTRKHYNITEVKRGPETKIEGTTLYIREGIEAECAASQELVLDFKIDIVTPAEYNTYSETIMDVQPIATKEGDDELGYGTTRVLDGVVMMVTGVDEDGVQVGEFGSSEGILEENIMWGRPGCPEKGEIFIKTFAFNVATELEIFQSATAAGNKYTAADGSVLFGCVIVDIPDTAWSGVTLSLGTTADAETVFVKGSIAASELIG